MTITTKIFSKLFGKKTGEDEFGNRYFTNGKSGDKSRRWVIYRGVAEASKVPSDWHRWLHKTTDEAPASNKKTYKWEKQHLPNLSGGDLAYVPKGHLKRGGKRDKTTGDYQAWKP
jgi:NADH:ubiquinone oxidoreductase subunit